MLNSWLDIIATKCESSGFGTVGTSLFKQTLPSTPTQATVVRAAPSAVIVGDPVRRPILEIVHRRSRDDMDAAVTFVGSLDNLFRDAWNNLDTDNLGRFVGLTEPGDFVMDANNNVLFLLRYVFYTVGN